MNLPHGVREHVERELYTYPVTRQEIADRRRYLIEGGDGRDPADPDLPLRRSAVTWSDPTAYAGTALAEDRRLRELERITRAIEDVIEHPRIPPEQRAVITRWYFDCEPLHAIEAALHLSRPTIYRIRAALLAAIAARLGWI